MSWLVGGITEIICHAMHAKIGRTGTRIPLNSSKAATELYSFQFEAAVLQITQRHSTVSKKL